MKYRIRKQNYMLQGFIGWDLPIPFYNTMSISQTLKCVSNSNVESFTFLYNIMQTENFKISSHYYLIIMRVGVTVLLYWLPCAPSTTIFPSIVLILCYRAKMFLVDN